METISRPLHQALPENRRQLRKSEQLDPSFYAPDPTLSRQQRRLAERQAAKEGRSKENVNAS